LVKYNLMGILFALACFVSAGITIWIGSMAYYVAPTPNGMGFGFEHPNPFNLWLLIPIFVLIVAGIVSMVTSINRLVKLKAESEKA
jgi:hypothetical protein